GLTYYDFKRNSLSKWFDTILFGVVGLVGLLLLLLWIATDHKAAANNFNLLWAFPAHAVVLFWFWKSNKPQWFVTYFKVTSLVLFALLTFWALLPQDLNVFLIPLVILLLIRSWIINRLCKLI
ncbi:MAG: hypothetical protein JJE09_03490, partial [Bacteroidia bacterium]|nr:hypothetical protein [Bacteroidia bacterium]